MKKEIFKIFLFSSVLLFYSICFADEFAEERARSNALSFINIEEAYELGYTGKGITVGVIDSLVNLNHPELNEKTTIYNEYESAWLAQGDHGSHIAGIIAAKHDGFGMHGVAYDALIHNFAHTIDDGDSTQREITPEEFFTDRPDMRIVNNSYGAEDFPVQINAAGEVEDIPGHTPYYHQNINYLSLYIDTHPELLLVFASGNSGRISPSSGGLYPRYAGLDLANWITVGGLNQANMSYDNSGNIVVSPLSVFAGSNLAAGAERFTLFAPAFNIYSVNAANDDYIAFSGTSMAAPVVSGALALVEQAYPWMTGKQLADAVLSTANNSFIAPEFFISYTVQNRKNKITFYYVDTPAPALTKDEAKQLFLAENQKAAQADLEESTILQLIEAGDYEAISLSREQAFGRGILDVGKAVQGIALLDINRLSASHALEVPELISGGIIPTQALEVFDTRDYYSVFSNDIAQEKWNDTYHHADFRTTGTKNTNALALNTLNAGIIKRGSGALILMGDNSYAGATIIENGTLGLIRREDGSGGRLRNSDVIVRKGGTFLSHGGIVDASLINSGTVHVLNSNHTSLTVDEYVQHPNATLQLEFSPDGTHANIHATTAHLDGTLEFLPMETFYAASDRITYDIFSTTSGIFNDFSKVMIEDLSPSLSFSYSKQGNDTYSLTVERKPDAYAQYANSITDKNVGHALYAIAPLAHDHMQTLLTDLDFSALDGSHIKEALYELSPRAFEQLANVSLGQQRQYNSFITGRMLHKARLHTLSTKAEALAQDISQGISAGSSPEIIQQNPWQAWASVLGSNYWQGSYENNIGIESSSVGMVLGIDRTWSSGLSAGLHASLSNRQAQSTEGIDATTQTDSLSVGIHAHFAPHAWDGFYIMGQGRIGYENNSQERHVRFTGYDQQNSSNWTNFVGSALLGGGKDWSIGPFTLGPILWFEYSFLQQPEITENNNTGTALKIHKNSYQSIRSSLGAHMGFTAAISENLILDMDIMATWQYELLDNTPSISASFKGYDSVVFSTKNSSMGRNSYMAQGSVRMTYLENYFAECTLGAESNDSNGNGFNIAFNIGFNF